MKNESKELENYIYTDTYYTKKQLHDAYFGFLEHYSQNEANREHTKTKHKYLNNYIFTDNLNNIIGMVRYSTKFYILIKYSIPKFKTIAKEEKQIKEVMNKEEKTNEDFKYLIDVFSRFMDETGIMNITMQEEDLSKSVEKNR